MVVKLKLQQEEYRLLSLMVCNTKTRIIKPNKGLRGRNNNRCSFYVSLKITIQMCSMQERFTHIKSQRIELLLVMGTSTFTQSTCARYISFYSDAVNELIWWRWGFLGAFRYVKVNSRWKNLSMCREYRIIFGLSPDGLHQLPFQEGMLWVNRFMLRKRSLMLRWNFAIKIFL